MNLAKIHFLGSIILNSILVSLFLVLVVITVVITYAGGYLLSLRDNK